MTGVAEQRVAKRRAEKTDPEGPRYELTRVGADALAAARIACAYRGLSLAEYLSLVVQEASDRDIEDGHRRRSQHKPKD